MAEQQNQEDYQKLPRVSLEVLQEITEDFEIFHYQDEEYLRRYTRLEQAYYYFLDNYVYQPNKIFKKCSKYKFFCYVHRLDPLNWFDEDEVSNCFSEFIKFRSELPIYGAIILSENMEEVVMVQDGFEQFWSFPKGKIDFDETPVECAIREVYEEVGLDISEYIDFECCVKRKWEEKECCMYIIKNFPKDIELFISNPHKISKVEWVRLDYLFKNLNNQDEFPLSRISKKMATKFKRTLKLPDLDTT